MTPAEALLLAAAAFAVAKATRLVVNDAWPFKALRDRLPKKSWPQRMVTCPWCFSGWASLCASLGLWATTGLPVPPVAWFAIWGGSSLVYWWTEAMANAADVDGDPPETLGDGFDFR